jgi:hypothetical protein
MNGWQKYLKSLEFKSLKLKSFKKIIIFAFKCFTFRYLLFLIPASSNSTVTDSTSPPIEDLILKPPKSILKLQEFH